MVTLQSRLEAFVNAVGNDVKQIGQVETLTTSAKTSIVDAINEVQASIGGSPNDSTDYVAIFETGLQ